MFEYTRSSQKKLTKSQSPRKSDRSIKESSPLPSPRRGPPSTCTSPTSSARRNFRTKSFFGTFPELIPEPVSKSGKFLVFDLDETLIYSHTKKPQKNYQTVHYVSQGVEYTYYVTMRPGLLDFLDQAIEDYDLFIYSTASLTYLNVVLKALKISHYFNNIYDKDYCWPHGDVLYTKNLKKVGFDLCKTILVDDNLTQAINQPGNTIRIKKFKGDTDDKELVYLLGFLKLMCKVKDMRRVSTFLKDFKEENFYNYEAHIAVQESLLDEKFFASSIDSILTAETDFPEEGVSEAVGPLPINVRDFKEDASPKLHLKCRTSKSEDVLNLSILPHKIERHYSIPVLEPNVINYTPRIYQTKCSSWLLKNKTKS